MSGIAIGVRTVFAKQKTKELRFLQLLVFLWTSLGLNQTTKLRIKYIEIPSLFIVFQQKTYRKSQKGVSLHSKNLKKV